VVKPTPNEAAEFLSESSIEKLREANSPTFLRKEGIDVN
jgi:hypothetical protein